MHSIPESNALIEVGHSRSQQHGSPYRFSFLFSLSGVTTMRRQLLHHATSGLRQAFGMLAMTVSMFATMDCQAEDTLVTAAAPEALIAANNVSLGRPLTAEHPIDSALQIAVNSLNHVRSNVNDYTAVFVKRCRVDGELPPLQFAKLKIKNRRTEGQDIVQPLSVYLDFIQPKAVKGREVIWVENKNDGKLLVHQGGLASFLTVKVDPDGPLAMRGQRYSVRQIGIENLLRQIIQTGLNDRKYGDCQVAIRKNVKFGDSMCTVIEIEHAEKADHFRFHRAQVFFDDQLQMPVRYKAWTWPTSADGEPVLDEEYNYMRLQVNVGLEEEDFDQSNPSYRFH